MSKRQDTSGHNSRFGANRHRGFGGATGFNKFPREDEISWSPASAAGNYDSAETLIALTDVAQITINVTTVYDGVPTFTCGPATTPDQFVNIAQAVDLTILGKQVFAVQVSAQSLAAADTLRVVVGGAPTQGAMTVTADFQV